MRPSPIGVEAAAYHLPGAPVDLVAWAAGEGVAPRLVDSLLASGCRYFHAGTPTWSDTEFIATAIDRLDAPPGWTRGVRYLVHAHTQAFSMPAPPASVLAELAARYGFELTLAFSVSQLACASVIAAIDAAARLLAADPDAPSALVVTSDRIFGNARYRIQGRTSVQSDGASAILLGRERLRCRLGPASFNNVTQWHDGPAKRANAFGMARYLWQHAVQLLRAHEAATGVTLQQVHEILPANVDRHDWDRVAEELALPPGKVYLDNVAARGHACCADFAVNLVDRGLAQAAQGRHVLAVGQSNVGAFGVVSVLPPELAGVD